MDDLSAVDWTSPKATNLPNSHGQSQAPRGNYYPTLRPTPPLSGRSTPSNIPTHGVGQKPLSNVPTGSKGSTPTNDSFANLVSFSTSQSSKNVSLQEQQRSLLEQKAKAEDERRRQFDSHFGGSHIHNISANPSGASTPNRIASPPTYTATEDYGGQKLSKLINKPFASIPNNAPSYTAKTPVDDEADILAAFNAYAPVDRSSHMPAIGYVDNLGKTEKDKTTPSQDGQVTGDALDDDDPFGLGVAAPKDIAVPKLKEDGRDEDDVLGLLGRPVSEFSEPKATEITVSHPPPRSSIGPLDRAMAELVDMGFSAEKSQLALESTDSGTDVQAAVGWLLNQAHEDSRKEKQQQNIRRRDSSGGHNSRKTASRRKSSGSAGSRPAWMKEHGPVGPSVRQNSKSPAKGEKDPAQYAQELGNNLFKTANNLWKSGTKKINQAVADLNSDVDPHQPKWMREPNGDGNSRKPRSEQRGQDSKGQVDSKKGQTLVASKPSVTDEALLLESGDARPNGKHNVRLTAEHNTGNESVRGQMQHPERRRESPPPRPKVAQQKPGKDTKSMLDRQIFEDEAAQAYISPARRRRPATKQTSPPEISQPDLMLNMLGTNSQAEQSKPQTTTNLPSKSRPPVQTSLPTRLTLPKRAVPPISPSAVQQSTSSRQAGTAAFKRGDYAAASDHYSKTLSIIPPQHPLALPCLTNRALSYLKTGDPKASIADAKTVLEFIGPSRGLGEVIDLGGEEGVKPMEVYWGKAMSRQAEALEQLEKWGDAAAAWRACVEAGVGGATSIEGRNRCENASKPKTAAPTKRPPPKPVVRPSALSDLRTNSGQSAEAVTRLRAAHAAADKLDDEKFKLADQVDARVMKWRAGKESNLRALLSSLENVLWEEAGWKRVGMGDVLLPNKVKIVYMRGIAKVHPDKVSENPNKFLFGCCDATHCRMVADDFL